MRAVRLVNNQSVRRNRLNRGYVLVMRNRLCTGLCTGNVDRNARGIIRGNAEICATRAGANARIPRDLDDVIESSGDSYGNSRGAVHLGDLPTIQVLKFEVKVVLGR